MLIVGAGRVGHALRNHIESLQHLGFRFKGFVALTRARGGVWRRGCDRRCAELPVAGAVAICGRDFFLGAGGEEAGDRHGGRGAGGRDRRPGGAGYVRRAGVECDGGVHRSVSDDSAASARTSRSAAFLVKRVLDITVSSLALVVGVAGDAGDCDCDPDGL